jgi:cytochrome c biogenesis protein CcmG, thiol:disulfide interchange protein DsbE
MSLHKAILSIGIFICFSFFILSIGCKGEVEAGPLAPDFSLSDLSGQTISLEQHRGSVVLLDFWATWCGPCKMTVPLLAKLHEQYKDNGLVILGVSVDDPQLVRDVDLLNYKKMAQIDYPLLRFNQEIMEDYFSSGQVAIPTMFVIDRSGRIHDKIVGFRPDALEKSVAAVIR